MKQITLLLAAAILAGNASARLTNVSKPMGTQTSPALLSAKPLSQQKKFRLLLTTRKSSGKHPKEN